MVKSKLGKEKFSKNSPIGKCDGCGEDKPIYLQTKVKVNHAEESIMCSKKCVKKVFGKSRNTKK